MSINEKNILNKFIVKADYFKSSYANVFDAIAQLVDNARDADAKNLNISKIDNKEKSGGFLLCFADDGCGMDICQLEKFLILTNTKNKRSNKIGLYGDALKTASFKIGNDMILFTKKDEYMSIIFFSSELNKDQDQMIIPMPSFKINTRAPYMYDKKLDQNENNAKHKLEIELILKYSPFKTLDDLMNQFEKIDTASGTRVIIYNLITFTNGKTEIEVKKIQSTHNTKFDIVLSNCNQKQNKTLGFVRNESTSLREYLSILYYKPEMNIFIQGDKVVTKFLELLLYQPKKYDVIEKFYKSNDRKEIKTKLNEEYNTVKNSILKLQTELNNKKDQHDRNSNRLSLSENNKYNMDVAKYQKQIDSKKDELHILDKKRKQEETSSNIKHKIQYLCGIYVDSRSSEGIYVYNNNRLIMIRDKKKQLDFKGVVCLINISYDVLEPSKYKNGFSNESEQRKILSSAEEIMNEYKNKIDIKNILKTNGNPNEFWRCLGYLDNFSDEPSDENQHKRLRIQILNGLKIQCCKCRKWRSLRWSGEFAKRIFPSDNWACEENDQLSCNIAEEIIEIPSNKWSKPKQIEPEISKKPSSSLSSANIQKPTSLVKNGRRSPRELTSSKNKAFVTPNKETHNNTSIITTRSRPVQNNNESTNSTTNIRIGTLSNPIQLISSNTRLFNKEDTPKTVQYISSFKSINVAERSETNVSSAPIQNPSCSERNLSKRKASCDDSANLDNAKRFKPDKKIMNCLRKLAHSVFFHITKNGEPIIFKDNSTEEIEKSTDEVCAKLDEYFIKHGKDLDKRRKEQDEKNRIKKTYNDLINNSNVERGEIIEKANDILSNNNKSLINFCPLTPEQPEEPEIIII